MNCRTRAAARHASGILLAASLLTAAACSSSGGKLYPVTGKVLANGKPAAGAFVTFHPEGASGKDPVTSTGVTEDDGTFTLTTGSEKGAKEGKYVVTVMWTGPPKKQAEKTNTTTVGGIDAPDAFDGKYLSRDKSTLKAEVKPGDNKLEPFDLK